MFKVIIKVLLVLFFVQLRSEFSFAQGGNVIVSEDSKIHYQTFGSGYPILIINGGPGMSSEGFIPLAKQLAENHRTIIYDQRGTGFSTVDTVNSNTITMDLMVEDIEALRMHLGYDEWIVMGHSFGGIMGYYYASKHPERVTAMIQSSSGGMDLELLSTLDITAGLTEMQADSLAYYSAKISEGDNSYETLLKRGQFLAPAYLYNQEYVPVVAERLTQGNSQINGLVWQDLRQINYDTKEALQNFAKPVLILHGAQDVVGIGIAETADEIFPDAKLVILDRCRHYGWLDRPEAYFGEIETFLIDLKNNLQ